MTAKRKDTCFACEIHADITLPGDNRMHITSTGKQRRGDDRTLPEKAIATGRY